jgi:hypothetical protein
MQCRVSKYYLQKDSQPQSRRREIQDADGHRKIRLAVRVGCFVLPGSGTMTVADKGSSLWVAQKQPEFSVRSAAEWGTGECDEVDQEDRRGHEVDDRGRIFGGRIGDWCPHRLAPSIAGDSGSVTRKGIRNSGETINLTKRISVETTECYCISLFCYVCVPFVWQYCIWVWWLNTTRVHVVLDYVFLPFLPICTI